MTEQQPETQPEQLPDTEQTGDAIDGPRTETDDSGLARSGVSPTTRPLSDAPDDIGEDTATGYAVYNRTLGQYVPGVEKKKPSSAQAAKRVPEGHTAAVVRV